MAKKLTYEYVKEKVEEKGYVLLDKEYKNAHQKLNLKDKEGYMYQTNFNKIQSGRSPVRFGKNNEYTIYNISNYLKNNNYTCKLLSTTYVTNKEKLEWKCECNTIFERSLDRMLNSKGVCLKCSGQEKYSMEEIEEISLSKGLTPLFEDYGDVNKKLDFLTTDGYKIQTSIQTLLRYEKKYKRIFHKSNKYSLGNIRRYLKNNNIETKLLSTKYNGVSEDLLWECGICHQEYLTTFNNFKSSAYVCTVCADKKGHDKLKLTKKDIEEYIINHTEYNLINIDGVGKDAEVEVRCSCGSKYITKFSNIRYGNNRCKVCTRKISYGEYYTEKKLNENNIEYISQHKFEDCKFEKYLYFDFYIPNRNVCIEIDGEQHRKPIEVFGGLEEFEKTKMRDKQKDEYCKEKGLILIRVPYYADRKRGEFNKSINNIIKSLIE